MSHENPSAIWGIFPQILSAKTSLSRKKWFILGAPPGVSRKVSQNCMVRLRLRSHLGLSHCQEIDRLLELIEESAHKLQEHYIETSRVTELALWRAEMNHFLRSE